MFTSNGTNEWSFSSHSNMKKQSMLHGKVAHMTTLNYQISPALDLFLFKLQRLNQRQQRKPEPPIRQGVHRILANSVLALQQQHRHLLVQRVSFSIFSFDIGCHRLFLKLRERTNKPRHFVSNKKSSINWLYKQNSRVTN